MTNITCTILQMTKSSTICPRNVNKAAAGGKSNYYHLARRLKHENEGT